MRAVQQANAPPPGRRAVPRASYHGARGNTVCAMTPASARRRALCRCPVGAGLRRRHATKSDGSVRCRGSERCAQQRHAITVSGAGRDERATLRRAATWPLLECIATKGWDGEGQIVVARRGPPDPMTTRRRSSRSSIRRSARATITLSGRLTCWRRRAHWKTSTSRFSGTLSTKNWTTKQAAPSMSSTGCGATTDRRRTGSRRPRIGIKLSTY